MRAKNGKNVWTGNAFWTLAVVAMMTAIMANAATAKSLYVIADIKGSTIDATQPVHAYDIGVDGTLTFQAQNDIPHRMLGAVGLAIDSDSGYLFVTYEASDTIQLVDGTTMTGVGRVFAEGANDLAGVVYDHTKKLLYCVDRGLSKLYVYNWATKTITLTPVGDSPFILKDAHAYGIALDEIDGLLYVANANNTVTVYNTSDWSMVEEIELSRLAISIAVDVMNGYMYTGGGYAGNNYLTQYNLASRKEEEVLVEPDDNAGVMGLGVDADTGLVYMSTGHNNEPGGDNLLVYDMQLHLIGKTHIGGNPTGLAIPGKDIGFNPLNLTKELVSGAIGDYGPGEMPAVSAGKSITYGIGFSNTSNDFTVTGVTVVDKLPDAVTFVTADDDGVGGHYDSKTHTYRWSYVDLPPKTSTRLDLTVLVKRSVELGTVITNLATINSNQTPPTTTRLDVVATNTSLNLEKSIVGAVEGQVAKVEPNDLVTYKICFDNEDNNFIATDVLVVDTLPQEVSFVSADKLPGSSRYDLLSHTYTWWPSDLNPGASFCANLVVRVNPDVPLGTVITNFAVIDCNETPAHTVSVDAVTYELVEPPSISKSIVDSIDGQPTVVGPGNKISYLICVENVGNASALTEVSVVDTLPPEVNDIVTANPVGKKQKDKNGNLTYVWNLPDLLPKAKAPVCLELVVKLKDDVDPAATVSNSATVFTLEAPPATATADLGSETPVQSMTVVPDIIRQAGDAYDVQVILMLPPGIGKDDVRADFVPVLTPGDIKAKDYAVFGTDTRSKVIAKFDKAEILNAVNANGYVTLKVKGKLSSGLYYVGEAEVYISRFIGN